MRTPRPPKLFVRFFKWYCRRQLQEQILGDLEEQFEEDVKAFGSLKAKLRFSWNIIRFIHPKIIKPTTGGKLNYYGMFKNYFITSIRFIKREKVFALMNISGLALGIACAIVIYKILDHEYSYNKHHQNYDNLYRVVNEDITTRGKLLYRGQTHPLASALRNDFQGINATMTFYDRDGLIGIPDGEGNIQRFQEKKGVAFVEPQFLEMFTLRFLVGDQKNALSEPGKVIITESKAKKYFGLSAFNLQEAIGREIVLENEKTLYVSAVVKDEPTTSDFPFEVIFHYMDQDAANPWFRKGQDWDEYNSATNCYVLLENGINAADFEVQLESIVDKYLPEHAAKNRTYRLQPFSDLHYSAEIRSTYAGVTSTKNELMILGLVGLFLIITACINFINLSTAQAVKRSKEVGVRKTMGSSRGQLVTQFLCETFIITVLATIGSLFLATFLVGEVAEIFKYEMQIDLLSDVHLIYFLLSLIVGVTIIAGIYPSLILARMNPILAVKNSLNVKQTSGFLSLRKGLVVLQFAISQILIIGILILKAQMDFFQTKDLGFNDESIVVVDLPENDSTRLGVLKSELLSHSSISKVSFSTSSPMAFWRSTNPIFHPNIEGQDISGNLKNVDADYFELYEMELIAGEPFKESDPSNHVVINRKLTEVLGFEDPHEVLGEKIKYGRGSLETVVVGVVKDFHSASLRSEMDNVLLANYSWNIFQANIKLHPNENSFSEFQQALNHIEKSWEAQFPEHVFDASFYDEQLAAMYTMELSVAKVFKIFVVIAILIGALGLYGLVAFMANQKTKEIGIRKVMGASEMAIWNIFSKEFVLLLIIAFFISGPISYFLMNEFLTGYAYRITIGPSYFLVAIVASIAIALVTVGHKSWKVARANPVDALQDE